MSGDIRYRRMAIAALAVETVLAPAMGAAVGYYLDHRFGWSPWGVLTGLGAGVLVSAQLLVDLIKRLNKNDEES